MIRHLTALVLLPAMALAGVSFDTDVRPINRTAPGASYADMLARIMPAVVSIRTAEVIPQSVLDRYRGRIDKDSVLKDEKTGETFMPTGLGSGTIIHPEGYVITNRHVVLKSDRSTVSDTVIVQLQDRREFRAKVLGVDAGSDIAVLKIEGRNLPFAKFADSEKARVGDVVFAIGNPLDAGITVTSGIVSALGRSGKQGMGMAEYRDQISHWRQYRPRLFHPGQSYRFRRDGSGERRQGRPRAHWSSRRRHLPRGSH